jgi:GntR family transcriptional regulator
MSEASQGPGFHPLYLQVKELMIRRLVAGRWKPGDLLPSEGKLAAEFHVSQGTVRKALEELAAEHLVVRHQGKGTFVSARAAEFPVHFFSVVTRDNVPVTLRRTVSLDWAVAKASAREQNDLKLTARDEVFRINRVRELNGRPAISERIVIERRRFPGFPDRLREADRTNTYLVMERDFGVLVVRAEEWLNAVTAGRQEASDLSVEPGAPLLQIIRICYAVDGSPVEWRRIRLNSEDYLYHNIVS